MEQIKNSRRRFIRTTVSSAVGIAVFPHIIPASSLGRGGVIPPSDRIVMGAIGVGSMGTGNMRDFLTKKEVQFIAVCDVDENHRNRAKDIVDTANNNKECRTYLDFREFLENENPDAVCIALPDHWHAIISVAVADKGIDIYGEKPLARTVREGRSIVDAVERNDIIWQTGSWQRSRPQFHRACELVRNGFIGKVTRVEVGLPDAAALVGTPPVKDVPEYLDWDFWLGPAPEVPYRGICHWDWRWIMDYSGGQLTDWAGHHVDIAHWGLNLDRDGPVEVEGTGVYPREGIYDVPFEYDINCKYANGIEMRIANQSRMPFGMGTAWYGDNGWIHVARGNRLTASDPSILENEIPPEGIRLYYSRDHHQNFLDCVKTREETITPVQTAHRSISVALIGEIAMLTGQKLIWNPDNERFTGNETANRLLSRPFRSPWTL
ncbi:MAG: Gfo/Idh/MocA family oxidoreductase [Bacteroidales bacterium]|nr:MAG: Gfo/Idh/MocA family oxidoreductase [Bacteroidales bacterium]